MFVRYHPIGAYKLYDLIEEKMVLSRDVMVLEEKSWDWNEMQTRLRKTKVNGIIDNPTLAELEEAARNNDASQHIVS